MNAWKWDDFPAKARQWLQKDIDDVCLIRKHDRTVELRTRIKLLREILALPDTDPNEGFTDRVEEE